MEKKRFFLKGGLINLLPVFGAFLILLVVASCNNQGEKAKTISDDTTKMQNTKDESPDLLAANVNFPIFKIDKTDLITPHGKKPSKLIIKFKFSNFANPLGSLTLLLYSAKNHAQYAENDNPVEIVDITQGTKSIPKGFILGNNEIDFKYLLKAGGGLDGFSYLVLTPDLYTDPQGRNHLIFQIEAFDAENKSMKTGEKILAIPNSNPSPPAYPLP